MPRLDWTWDEIMIVARHVEDNNGRELRAGTDLNKRAQDLLNRATIHPTHLREQPIRSEGSVSHKSGDLLSVHPEHPGGAKKGGRTTAQVVTYWHENPRDARAEEIALEEMIERGEPMQTPEDGDAVTAIEGTALIVRHRRRERNPALRTAKIKSAATLDCEVCEFNFGRAYGERGTGYVEVHHTLPLHISGTVETKLDDLALLCSNCHRMIHRSPWVTPSQLRAHLADH